MNYLGLSQEQVASTGKSLNQLLANYQLYYQNLRNFHWNVSGENFFDLHEKFEDLYEDARLKIDEIAERLLTLRLRPLSTTSAYLESAKIEEAGKVLDSHKMVKIILENHKILIADMRTIISRAGEVDDEGTIEMIGGFLSEIEKKSWMLDAWHSSRSKKNFPVEV
ncbi:MAG: Dps family protein [Lewinella sp.]|jgi:starvation-inducible DNA-binding protein|uniref:Dps family protein n=1 Tax=Lewinella sp. TaxID=2004506 RepID=UPI003D6A131E